MGDAFVVLHRTCGLSSWLDEWGPKFLLLLSVVVGRYPYSSTGTVLLLGTVCLLMMSVWSPRAVAVVAGWKLLV